MFTFKANKKTISLTINDYVVRMVENKNHTLPGVVRTRERELPAGIVENGKVVDELAFVGMIESCVRDWGIKNRPVQFFVPDSTVIMKKVEVPLDVADDEVNGYIMMELGSSIHLPFSNPVLDVHVLPAVEGQDVREGFLFAAPEDEVLTYTELLDEAKLKPIAADVTALALYRYFYQQDIAATKSNYLFAKFDLTTVNISIFSEHHPEFIRHQTLDLGNDAWTSSYQQETKQLSWRYKGNEEEIWSKLDDQLQEIERILNFYRYSMHQGNKQVTNIIVTGDHPYLTGIKEQLAERVEIPVSITEAKETDGKQSFSQGFIATIGLSLKEVT
ncbi:type IV pilus biogenesis protein PilM [Desertibacillus haloalkaliphilus]|uniref:type IV pilus biogenesis protein PilM n=1 Tax=Desertibacillus haloalkaliphilus TaxID=1328930 RepID=UPI001C26ABEC|nr:pilus assembly protein PilM [Desertibacillus haloalkaliphilus]MBU8905046.1 pilus assembly protein PilM [Desertibacillus haloalkaliphilus]